MDTSQQTPLSILAGSKSMAVRNPKNLSALKNDEVQLGEKVRSISLRMKKLERNSMEELLMVDTIQRLGMDHLFQQEICEVLSRHYYHMDQCLGQSSGLHQVSLRFRLLRQAGYNVDSANTFEVFLGQDKKFKEDLDKDTQGLVSLFEASQLRMHGERILDEANMFSKRILSTQMDKLDESQTIIVQNALEYPIQKTLSRFTAHDILSSPSSAKGWRNDLQELAKMDFNVARTIYQNELHHISNWWKNLGLAKELKFARDKPLKWHMWSLGALSDPRMSEERILITKPISFIYIIDDIFDVYGKPRDLSLFTEAVNRWESDTLDALPEYMKICLNALFDVTNEISHQIWFKYGHNPMESLQKAWTDLINAFLVESKWFATGYLPTTTEYLEVATITSGIHVVLTHMYFILGGGSEDTHEYNGYVLDMDHNKIMSSTAMVLRLWDDLGSSEDEDQDGHDGSYIKCYLNEVEGVSIESARERVVDLISGAWKNLNQESMKSPPYIYPLSPNKTFTTGCLNLARMVPLMYNYDEHHQLPDLERFVTSLLHHRY